MAASDRWVAFGRIGRPHGLRGECRFFPFRKESPLLDDLSAFADVRLIHPETGERRTRLVALRGASAEFRIATIEGITSRDAVESWTHAVVEVPAHVFPPAEDDEFYAWQLRGLTLVLESGEKVGEVLDLTNFGGGDLLAVRYRGREEFVPFAEPWIGAIDRDARTCVLRPEGLLDDDETPPPRSRG